MDYAIGIDLGGTNIKSVAVTRDGALLDRLDCETGDGGTEAWAEKVRRQAELLEERRGRPARWIGLASPGLAAPDGRSVAVVSGRMSRLRGFDWACHFGRKPEVPVLNDAQAALLAEAWRGAAAGRRHAILLTLGTGVGGAILLDGRLVRGSIGRAGELGHMSVRADGAPDSVGIPGSLEDAIGDHTLPARSGGRFTSTRDLVEAHRAGDREATEIWLRSVYELACAIASLINVLDPEIVVIGGGITAAGRELFDPLEKFLGELEWRPYDRRVPVVPAALGSFAGALGAALNAMRRAQRATDEHG